VPPWLALAVALSPVLLSGQQVVTAQRLPVVGATPSPFALAASEFVADVEALRTAPSRLRVLLPEGGELVLEATGVDVRPTGDVVWSGRVEGDPGSTAMLSVHAGLTLGTIRTASRAYRIQIRNGGSVLELLDPNRPLPGNDSAAVPAVSATTTAASVAATTDPAAGDAEIDVAVFHTAAALDYVGGEAAMLATIDGLIDRANAVFANSGVAAHYRLVHVAPASQLIRDADDGANVTQRVYQDGGILAARTTYGADLVALLLRDISVPAVCGIAGTGAIYNGPQPLFFAQQIELETACDPGDTFAHENGHLLGLAHDPGTAASRGEAPPILPYAQGHTVAGLFGTIMSYGTPAIPYLSSPDLLFAGEPIGIADERDNARAARENAPLVAAYRPPGPPPPTAPPEIPNLLIPAAGVDFDGSFYVSVGWFPVAQATSYDVERSTDGLTFFPVGTPATNTFRDDAVSSPNVYTYRVRARNFRGASPFSEPRGVTMPVPPAAPSGLTATAQGATDVLLRWTDNSTDERGFFVEMLVNGVFEAVVEAPANATQVVFAFGQPSTAHTFQARAFTDVLTSAPSNTVTVTTLAANPGVVSGVAFHDANRNGRADVGEVPAANLVVYHDINNNGVLDELAPPLVAPQVVVSSSVRNAPGTNLPYVGTTNYTLRSLPFGTRRICASFTPQNGGTSFCRTVTIQSSGTTTGVNFPVVEGKVGVSTMTPATQTVRPFDPVFVDVQWTHTGGRWVALKNAVIRFAAAAGSEGLQIRFDEASRTFSVYHPVVNRWSRPLPAGTDDTLHTLEGALVLRDTQVLGTGPTGPSVTLRLALRFSPLARGKTYRASILLEDDDGFLQGFDDLGAVTVARR